MPPSKAAMTLSRLQFAFRLLHGYKSETRRLPARSRSGDTASLLLLAMDPVLV